VCHHNTLLGSEQFHRLKASREDGFVRMLVESLHKGNNHFRARTGSLEETSKELNRQVKTLEREREQVIRLR
jgi:hypothetical protein